MSPRDTRASPVAAFVAARVPLGNQRLNRLMASRTRSGAAAAERRADAVARSAARGEPVPVARLPSDGGVSALGLGRGRPLDRGVARALAGSFGDLPEHVRVHDDRAAERATRQVDARAFAYGTHLVFGRGEYRPRTADGLRVLTHELGHVASGDSARSIHRIDGERDYDAEVSRLNTSEIEAELESVRARLLTLTESGPEYDDLDRRRAALERALLVRDRPRIAFQRLLAGARERTTADDPSALTVVTRIETLRGPVFVVGVCSGFASELAPGTALDAQRELLENPHLYMLGYAQGLPVGVWHGLVNLIEGLGSLIQLGFQMSITGQMLAFARDPAGYIEARRREIETARRLARALADFGRAVREDPTVILQLHGDLGFLVGQELADVYADFASQSAQEMGYVAGDIVGQIVFEVLLEILLALATEGIGNVLRGVAAVGQGARAGGRLANAIRRLLEASPALRRVVAALTGVDDLRHLERGAGAMSEAAGVARTERRAAGAMEDVGEASSRVDDVVRQLDEAEPHGTPMDETPARAEGEAAAPREPEVTPREETPPAPRDTAAEEAAAIADEPLTPAEARLTPEARARARAAEADNFHQIEPLVGRRPPPTDAELRALGYRYVRNSHPPPPRRVQRLVADDDAFARLTVDSDGVLQFPTRRRPTPDVRFDPSTAIPEDVPAGARLSVDEALPTSADDAARAARERPRTVGDALQDRRRALAERERLLEAGDTEGAGRAAARARRATEELGDAAATRYMEARGATPVYRGRGPNTVDQVWSNPTPPPDWFVIEAKGGSSTNTSSRIGEGGLRYQQGTRGYLQSILEDGNLPPERADELLEALDEGRLQYIEVAQRLDADGNLAAPVARRYF